MPPLENRLSTSASAYLRSAKDQPVAWQEWGPEALALAQKLDRPVLLDIGAVWCHWCHVIDRESYENAEIAKLINENFVPVKVDRDERPDVDRRYQTVIGALTGGGGWPLTGFLTPEGRVFFGGTYFPPDDAMGRPGLKRLLRELAKTYRDDPKKVREQAERMASQIASHEEESPRSGKVESPLLEALADALHDRFDPEHGGFGKGGGPKFPSTGAVEFALWRAVEQKDERMAAVVRLTLEAMAQGGVHDHVGGGFHRYSVDPYWHVPHFEKMAYDNSELLRNYAHAARWTGDPRLRSVAEGIIRFVTEVLSDPREGGFYAFQDADISLEDDGSYFTWTKKEIEAALAGRDREIFVAAYNIRTVPRDLHEMVDRNVLYRVASLEEVANTVEATPAEVEASLGRSLAVLREVRAKRSPAPFVDPTLFTAYNAMMAGAFFEAAGSLRRPECAALARKSLDRLLSRCYRPGKGMLHADGNGVARGEGLLDDQVWTAWACTDAYAATGEARYLDIARDLVAYCDARLWDAKGGGYFDRDPSGPEPDLGLLGARKKNFEDAPMPGGNAVAALVNDRLAALTDAPKYAERAGEILQAFAGVLPGYGTFAATLGLAAAYHLHPPPKVVIVGRADDPARAALVEAAESVYRPGSLTLALAPDSPAAGNYPRPMLRPRRLPPPLRPPGTRSGGSTTG
ncbi:MAG: thioredoxin domain-containing protein [Planctomycetes bacterium]|nr:thioredoxin domain-containing protein [Planctomycetota bacterium]